MYVKTQPAAIPPENTAAIADPVAPARRRDQLDLSHDAGGGEHEEDGQEELDQGRLGSEL
jgi:hypothetical protein